LCRQSGRQRCETAWRTYYFNSLPSVWSATNNPPQASVRPAEGL
jgi:hypothetical protein